MLSSNDVSLYDNSLTSNWASGFGGAIYSLKSHFNALENNYLENNEASTGGGGLCMSEGNMTVVTANSFISNIAELGTLYLNSL